MDISGGASGSSEKSSGRGPGGIGGQPRPASQAGTDNFCIIAWKMAFSCLFTGLYTVFCPFQPRALLQGLRWRMGARGAGAQSTLMAEKHSPWYMGHVAMLYRRSANGSDLKRRIQGGNVAVSVR